MALEGGALVGTVVGSIIFLCVVVVLLWIWWVRGNKVQTQRRLDGKTVVITGANTGIGKASASELSRRGAKIVMLCRNLEKAERTADEIRKESEGEVIVHQLDLSSLASVRQCTDQLNNSMDKIDILINNAAIVCPQAKTEDGYEVQFATNHLGHFLLTNLLIPQLKKAAPDARIINVSSDIHKYHQIQWEDIMFQTTPYVPIKAYAQSKLANILFTNELARKGEGSGVTAYAVHPGSVKTDIGHQAQDELNCCTSKIVSVVKNLFKSPNTGAQTTLYCAMEESLEGKSGGYYSGCKEVNPSVAAQNMEDAARLWRLSEELTQLNV